MCVCVCVCVFVNELCEALCYDAKHFLIVSIVETIWFLNIIGLYVVAMLFDLNMYVHK